MASLVYLVGVILCIIPVLDILKKPISLVGKIISCVLVLATSWIGLLVYFLFARDRLTKSVTEAISDELKKTAVLEE